VSGERPAQRRVEIVHESLLSRWPRLVRWQTQDADGAQLRDQLRQAANLWEQRGRPEDLLWTGTSYREYELWRERYGGGLTATEEAFGRTMAARAQRRRRRRRLALAGGFALLWTVLLVVAYFWRQSEASRRRAEAETRRAEAAKVLALGRLELDDDPTAALAYAIKSLELHDQPASRRFAVEALWRGPAFVDSARDAGWETESISFSRDGAWLGMGLSTGGVAVRRREGGGVRILGRTEGARSLVRFTRDGRLVSKSPAERWLRFWSPATGKGIPALDLGPSAQWNLTDRLLVLSHTAPPPRLRSWDVAGDQLRELCSQDFGSSINARELVVALDRPGTLVAWGAGRKVGVAPLQPCGRAPLRELGRTGADVVDVAFHAGDRRLASLDRTGEIRSWPLVSGRPESVVLALPRTGRAELYFDRLGRWLTMSDARNLSVELIDLAGPALAEPLVLRPGEVVFNYGKAFTPDGKWLASAHFKEFRLWALGEPRSYEVRQNTKLGNLAFVENGAFATRVDPSLLRVVPLASLTNPNDQALVALPFASPFLCPIPAKDPQGQWLLVGSDQPWLLPLRGGAARLLPGFPAGVGIGALAFSLDGRLAAAGVGAGPTEAKVIMVWDLVTGERRTLGPVPGAGPRFQGGVRLLGFTSDGHLVSSAGAGVFSWSLRDGRYERVNADTGAANFAMARDGRHLVASRFLLDEEGWASVVKLTDLRTGKTRELPAHAGGAVLALDPSGTILASGYATGEIRVSHIDAGAAHLLLGHTGPMAAVAFDSTGRWLASTGFDYTVRLWRVPDLSKPPLQAWPYDRLLAKLRSLTNQRVVEDATSSTGWKLRPDPFPGWQQAPTW
jgi:WD40 repeat protein